MTKKRTEDGFILFQCRWCHEDIVWARIEGTDRKVPLDPLPPVYAAKLKMEGKRTVIARRVESTKDGERVLGSHFTSCVAMARYGKFVTKIRRLIRDGKKVKDENFVRRVKEGFREFCT